MNGQAEPIPRLFPDAGASGDPEDGAVASPSLSQLVDRRMSGLFPEPGSDDAAASSPPAGVAASPGEAAVADTEPSFLMDVSDPDTVRMFCEITRAYIAPVRRFVEQLRLGPYSAAGLDMHRPAMEMVVRAAERLPVGELVPKLSRFTSALQTAIDSREATVTDPVRIRILETYATLEHALPAAFRLDEGSSPVDDVIVLALLRQIPDVGTVTLDKLFGAGLTSVDMFAEATPRDLAVTAGISESLATRICVRVQNYLVSRAPIEDLSARAEAGVRLAALVADLREAHQAYEVLRREDRVRWAHRRRRLDLALQIQVALAELGERNLVDALQPLSYDKRIDRLIRYVESIGGKVPRPSVR